MADHTSSIRPTPAQAGAGRLFLKRQVSFYASAPNCGPLRRFCRDGFSGITPKTPILPRSA